MADQPEAARAAGAASDSVPVTDSDSDEAGPGLARDLSSEPSAPGGVRVEPTLTQTWKSEAAAAGSRTQSEYVEPTSRQ